MNPRTKRLKSKPCILCGFPFSDEHHLYPRFRGGRTTITLCPNHHRAANIVQWMVERELQKGSVFDGIIVFAKKYFDDAFNAIVWKLIDAHCQEERVVANRIYEEGQ